MTVKALVPVVLPADPAAALEAATKQYVDAVIIEGDGPPPVDLLPGRFYVDRQTIAAVTASAAASVRLTRSSAQTLASGVNSQVGWNSEPWDIGGLHPSSGFTARITIAAGLAGLWLFGYSVSYEPNATGDRSTHLRVNGNIYQRLGMVEQRAAAGVSTTLSGSALAMMNEGDYAEVWAWQNSGIPLVIQSDLTASDLSTFWAVRLEPGVGSSTATPWTALALTSPWVPYGSGYATPMIRKVGDEVQLRGLAAHPSTWVADTTIATLPVGFRPPGRMISVAQYGINGGQGPYRINVEPSGTLVASPASTAAAGGWASLDDIRFSVTG